MSWGGIGAYVRACYDPVWVVAEDPANRERGDAGAP